MKKSDIIEKQFNRAFWGYDIVEVDQFLDEIADDIIAEIAEEVR